LNRRPPTLKKISDTSSIRRIEIDATFERKERSNDIEVIDLTSMTVQTATSDVDLEMDDDDHHDDYQTSAIQTTFQNFDSLLNEAILDPTRTTLLGTNRHQPDDVSRRPSGVHLRSRGGNREPNLLYKTMSDDSDHDMELTEEIAKASTYQT
jgi:hypothetical protein